MNKTIRVEMAMRRVKNGYHGIKDDNGNWYNIPDGKLNFGDGAVIVVTKGHKEKNWQIIDQWEVKKAGKYSGGSNGGAGGNAGGTGKSNYNDDDIAYRWATSHARDVTELLVNADALALGAKGKVEERKTIILETIDELTARYYTAYKGRTALKKAADIDKDLGEGDGDEGADDEGFGDGDGDDDDFE